MVGWAPVPKAWPGSTTRSTAPSRGGSQDGRSQSRSPTSSGLWKSRQRSAQSSGISVELTSTRPSPDRRVDLAQLRQLALAAVDRVLDVARARAPPRPRWAPAPSARPGPARPARACSGPRAGSLTRRGPSAEGAADAAEDALALPRLEVVRPRACSSRRSAISRCSSLRLVGTMTLKITRWSPRRRAPSRGSPSPRSTSSVPGLGAGRDLDLALARRASAPSPSSPASPRWRGSRRR